MIYLLIRNNYNDYDEYTVKEIEVLKASHDRAKLEPFAEKATYTIEKYNEAVKIHYDERIKWHNKIKKEVREHFEANRHLIKVPFDENDDPDRSKTFKDRFISDMVNISHVFTKKGIFPTWLNYYCEYYGENPIVEDGPEAPPDISDLEFLEIIEVEEI